MTFLRSLVVALCLGFGIQNLHGQTAAAQHDSYQRGLAALRAARWHEAIRFLSDAIHDIPVDTAHAPGDSPRSTDYTPYLYRGLAYYRTGDRERALEDFRRSQRGNTVSRGAGVREESAILRESLARLRALLGDEALTRSDETAMPGAPGRAERARLRPPASPPQEPPVEEELLRQGEALFAEGRYQAAREVFGNFLALYPGDTRATAYLDTIAANDRAIRRGITAYLDGEYAVAIQELTAAAHHDRATPQLYGFLAAAYAAAYFLSGDAESSFRELALESYRTARALDATYILNATTVSPRIISMLNSH